MDVTVEHSREQIIIQQKATDNGLVKTHRAALWWSARSGPSTTCFTGGSPTLSTLTSISWLKNSTASELSVSL